MKKIILFTAFLVLINVFSACAFLKKLMKDLPKQQEKQPAAETKTDTKSTVEQQKSSSGGLLDLGKKLGVKERDLKIIQAGAGALKSQQEITIDEELEIGGSLALEVVSRYGGQYQNEKVNEYVNLIGLTIAKYCDYTDVGYKFLVLNSEEINAFAAPGGYIFITKGLFYSLENEAQLAGVIAHEIAHVTQKHILKTLQRGKLLENLTILGATIAKENVEKYSKMMNEVNSTLFEKGVDQSMEYEADKFGVEYAYRAGYEPRGLFQFMQILKKQQGSKKSVFFSTHPNIDARINKMNNEVLINYNDLSGQLLKERFDSYLK